MPDLVLKDEIAGGYLWVDPGGVKALCYQGITMSHLRWFGCVPAAGKQLIGGIFKKNQTGWSCGLSGTTVGFSAVTRRCG
ncbi:MAG: hypothetical protein AB1441_06270 [Bacillota bacterium]